MKLLDNSIIYTNYKIYSQNSTYNLYYIKKYRIQPELCIYIAGIKIFILFIVKYKQ